MELRNVIKAADYMNSIVMFGVQQTRKAARGAAVVISMRTSMLSLGVPPPNCSTQHSCRSGRTRQQ
jgi:hypothetical protein